MVKVPVEDRLEIQELTHRAALFGDSKMVENNLALWTEDGVLDEVCVGMPRAEGQAAMRSFHGHPAADSIHSMSHFIANHIITTFDGNQATGLCYVWFRGITTGDHEMQIWGYYDDIYVKVDGQWRIKSRTLVNLAQPKGTPITPMPQLDRTAKHFEKY